MGKFNAVHISGNVVGDSEQEGNGPTKLTVAWNKPKKPTDGGDWTYVGHFFDVILWDKDVSFTKGQKVVVEGTLEQQRWENAEGEKRSKVVIVADSIGVRPSTPSQDPADPATDPAPGDEPGW